MSDSSSSGSFHNLNISPKILTILDHHKYTVPTPIQEQAIPIAVTGVDVIGLAQTGTGKTLAFGIPLVQRMMETGGMAVVVLPTRELALQVEETLQKIGRSLGVRSTVLIGGVPISRQHKELSYKPQILVVTPGRLIDHLQSGNMRLDKVNALVLDEADRMFDMGFAPQLRRILDAIPKERQTLMFSATMPAEIEELARHALINPVRIEVARVGIASEQVSQELYVATKEEKMPLLLQLLERFKGTVLVFSRTKHGAKRMTQQVNAAGYRAAEIHSNRSLAQRKDALAGFKNGTYRVLIATDIAARGIDVTGIELVVNFDLPDVPEDYVHRIGRTGRAGKTGHSISFASPDQGRDVQQIENLLGREIPRAAGSTQELEIMAGKEQRRRRAGNERMMSPQQPRNDQPRQPRNDQPRQARNDQPRQEQRSDRPANTNAGGNNRFQRPERGGDRRDGRPSEGSAEANGFSQSIQTGLKGFDGPRKIKRR